MRDEHQKCWRWTFFVSNFFMFFLTIAFIASGARVTQMNMLHKSMSFIWTEYLLAILFFTFFYFGMFAFGLCILAKKFNNLNRAVGCYAFFMFLIGFLIMATQGGVLGAMEGIDILELEDACRASPEELEMIKAEKDLGWLIVPLSKWAKQFDDYSESLLDGVMCTDTCPCYQSEETYHDGTSESWKRTDAYFKYDQLSEIYLQQYGRVFDAADAYGTDYIPFKWEQDRTKSYESFWECYHMYEKMAESDSTIDLDEKFQVPEDPKHKGGKGRKGKGKNRRLMKDIKVYLEMEDQFNCSGMCRKSLFYFGRNITEMPTPKKPVFTMLGSI